MLFVYAGLGMAMLLPIMAALQMALALSELELGNDQVLMARFADSRRSDEHSFMTQMQNIYFPDFKSKTSEFDASCPPLLTFGAAVGPKEDPSSCAYELQPSSGEALAGQGRARFVVKDSGSGAVHFYCYVSKELRPGIANPRQVCPG